MFRARLFDQFKGARTLVLWGDAVGMHSLRDSLSQLTGGDADVVVGEGTDTLVIGAVPERSTISRVRRSAGMLRWECSNDGLAHVSELLESLLLQGTGHQFLDAEGEAEQVIISSGEYPADLRQC